jgi:formylglycine-generating enzyme required for sulfatase activity
MSARSTTTALVAALALSCASKVSPDQDAASDRVIADDRPAIDVPTQPDIPTIDEPDAAADAEPDHVVPVEDSGCAEPPERPARTLRSCSGPNGAPTEHCREAFTCGGRFAMGHPDAWLFDGDIRILRMREKPCSYGNSSVRPGYIDAYPVSVARWRRWVQAGMPQPADGDYYFDRILWGARRLLPQAATSSECTWSETPGVNDSLPITCMGAAEAAAFCWWEGKHIVTEQMWEYVARNSATTERAYSRRAVEPFDRCRYGDVLRLYDCAANRARFGTDTAPIDAFPEGRTSFPDGVFIFGGLAEVVRSNRGLNGIPNCLHGPAGEATYSNGGTQSLHLTIKGVSYRMSPEHTAMAENPASLVPSLFNETVTFRCARWVTEPVSDG